MRTPADRRSRVVGYLLAVLAAACWATGGLLAKWLFGGPGPHVVPLLARPAGITVDPFDLAAGRAVLSFGLLAAVQALRRDGTRVRPSELPLLAVFGVIGLAGVHITYFKTISLTNVATAILLEYLAPVIVLVVGVVFLGHRVTWALPAGVVLSVSGCALVVGAIGGEGLQVSPAGVAWGLASAVFFAGYSLIGSAVVVRHAPLAALTVGLGFAALFWTLVLGPARVIGVFGDPTVAAALTAMSVISTIVPFAAFLGALERIPPANAVIASTLEPVIAAVGAFALFGERLAPVQLVGGALVLAAIVIVQLEDRVLSGTPAPA